MKRVIISSVMVAAAAAIASCKQVRESQIVSNQGPTSHAPPSEANLQAHQATASNLVLNQADIDRINVNVLNLYHGLIIVTHLDHLQSVLISGPVTDTQPFKTYFNQLGKKLLAEENSILAQFFARLANTKSTVPGKSVLDVFNGQILHLMKSLTGVMVPSKNYVNPIVYSESSTDPSQFSIDLGSFALWLSTIKRYPHEIPNSLKKMTPIEIVLLAKNISAINKIILNMIFSDSRILRWNVGGQLGPLLENAPNKRIHIPIDGSLELRRIDGQFVSLNLMVQRYVRDFRFENKLFYKEPNLWPTGQTAAQIGHLGVTYKHMDMALQSLKFDDDMSQIPPIHRGNALPPVDPEERKLGYPFTQRYFESDSPETLRLRFALRKQYAYASAVDFAIKHDVKNYLKFLTTFGFPLKTSHLGLGGVSGGFRPGKILTEEILMTVPKSSQLDSMLLVFVLYITLSESQVFAMVK